jgi:hypothetical protein
MFKRRTMHCKSFSLALVAITTLLVASESRADTLVGGFQPELWRYEGQSGFNFTPAQFDGSNFAPEDYSAWIRGSNGWNYIQSQPIHLDPALGCTARVLLHGSVGIQGVYFSAVDPNASAVISEVGPLNTTHIGPAIADTANGSAPDSFWREVRIDLLPDQLSRPLAFRIGFWGNGQDAHLTASRFSVRCPIDFGNVPS